MHASLGRYTVDDVERVVVVKSADTTNTYCGSTRRVTVSSNVYTRHTALHSLHRVVLVLFQQIIHAHYRYGTSEICLTLDGVARDHEFVQF